MIYRIERFFYYLLLISIPLQLGKHFWPDFAFVQGIRVDYLSPTLYLSDISVVLLFAFYLIRKRNIPLFFKEPLFYIGLFALLMGLFSAFYTEVVLLGVLKYIELVFVGFYVAHEVKQKDLGRMLFVLSLGAGIQLILAFFQLFSQSSLGGPFYFLGERTFSRVTPGIALFSFNESFYLRPYGSFPHPNVMGFYFFSLFFLLIGFLKIERKALIGRVIIFTLIMLFMGILLSFSRILIILLFVLLPALIIFYSGGKNAKKVIAAFFALGLLVFFFFFARFTQTALRDIEFRIDLLKIAWKLFIDHPFYGVGINNFYYSEIFFQKAITSTLLQPVHNVYLLILSQTGLIGGMASALFAVSIAKRFKKASNGFTMSLAVLLCGVFIIGFFDHYLITLQQGQMMLALILGLVFLQIKERE